jgi:predicted aldo/keto reductase-like oxidoreductase
VNSYTLNNNVEIPVIGFGVFQAPPEQTQAAVEAALRAGYRHIDTAAAYGNEREVGHAVRASGLAPDDVFLETKIWISDYGYHETLHGFEKSTDKLRVDHLDLLILHQALPSAFGKTLEAYRALDRLLEQGKVRAIGVSNFMLEHLAALLEKATVVPAVNQIEVHPFFQQSQVQALRCRAGHPDPGVVTDRRHHLLPRQRPPQCPRGPGHRWHLVQAREVPGSGDAALALPAAAPGDPKSTKPAPDGGELRRVRLRPQR